MPAPDLIRPRGPVHGRRPPSSHTVSTEKKSTASIVRACARTNSRHVDPTRLPAGPSPASRSAMRTVVADTAIPSPFSSPTIRRYPAADFSRQTHDQVANIRWEWMVVLGGQCWSSARPPAADASGAVWLA